MLKKEMRLFQRYKNITNVLYQMLLVVYPVYLLPFKKTHLVFLCDTAWLQYPLEDGEWWPVGGSLKYNTVLQLDQFCRKQGKWVEVAYVLPFFSLRNMPDLCPKHIDLGVTPSAPSSPPTLLDEMEDRRFLQSIPGIVCAEQPETEEQPHKLLTLHEAPIRRNNQSMRVNKPFSYQEIQRIKEDLGDYLEDPEKYIRAFKGVTLLYDLSWNDVMYILGQTLTPNSKA